MSWQHSCHGMCKIMLRHHCQLRSYKRIKFPSNLNYEGITDSETGPWIYCDTSLDFQCHKDELEKSYKAKRWRGQHELRIKSSLYIRELIIITIMTFIRTTFHWDITTTVLSDNWSMEYYQIQSHQIICICIYIYIIYIYIHPLTHNYSCMGCIEHQNYNHKKEYETRLQKHAFVTWHNNNYNKQSVNPQVPIRK